MYIDIQPFDINRLNNVSHNPQTEYIQVSVNVEKEYIIKELYII